MRGNEADHEGNYLASRPRCAHQDEVQLGERRWAGQGGGRTACSPALSAPQEQQWHRHCMGGLRAGWQKSPFHRLSANPNLRPPPPSPGDLLLQRRGVRGVELDTEAHGEGRLGCGNSDTVTNLPLNHGTQPPPPPLPWSTQVGQQPLCPHALQGWGAPSCATHGPAGHCSVFCLCQERCLPLICFTTDFVNSSQC